MLLYVFVFQGQKGEKVRLLSFELSDIMRNVIRNIKRNFHPLYCRPSGRRRRPGRFGRFSLRFPSVLTSRHISALSVISTLQSARRPFFHLSISNWIFFFFFSSTCPWWRRGFGRSLSSTTLSCRPKERPEKRWECMHECHSHHDTLWPTGQKNSFKSLV